MIDKKKALQDMMNGVRSPEAMKFTQNIKNVERPAMSRGDDSALAESHTYPTAAGGDFKDFGSFEALGATMGVSATPTPSYSPMHGGYPSISMDAVKNLVAGKKETTKLVESRPQATFNTAKPKIEEKNTDITKDEAKGFLEAMKPELKAMVTDIILDELLTGDRIEKVVMKTVLKVLKSRHGK
jgi:hypothetical protein